MTEVILLNHSARSEQRHILVVEDEPDIASLVALHLRDNDFQVTLAADGHEGMRQAFARNWDLVILDIRLPGPDGLTICRQLREIFDGPILIFTARDSDIDQVIGLEAGADDYVAKPVDPMVLLARTRALLRRVETLEHAPELHGDIVLGGLTISESSQDVWLDGDHVQLTTHEFGLLCLLARNAGKVLSRETLLNRVWGYEYYGGARTVDVHIRRLRAKIETESMLYIETVRNVGYSFSPQPQTGAAATASS